MKQLTLKEVIDRLESIGVLDLNGEPKSISFDFGGMVPTTVDSWRGSYDLPALGFSEDHKDAKKTLEELKSAVGREVMGWKGGDYILREDSYLWVDNPGRYTETGINGIVAVGDYSIVISTAYMEY